jgi:hypothetical protein
MQFIRLSLYPRIRIHNVSEGSSLRQRRTPRRQKLELSLMTGVWQPRPIRVSTLLDLCAEQ